MSVRREPARRNAWILGFALFATVSAFAGTAGTSTASCGNGTVEVDEECDDALDNSDTLPDACRSDCRLARCGDFVRDSGEECDDENSEDCDGCDECVQVLCILCGNGVIDQGEECDDGNRADHDGCNSSCLFEEECGDGIVQFGEQCDDGIDNSNSKADACRLNCRNARCGDGVTDSGEQCDDGNGAAYDACEFCRVPITGECGDSVWQPGEECEDGNLQSNDGCSASCLVEYCGDGLIQPPREECDEGEGIEGNANEAGRCRASGSSACRLPRCGDGIADFVEACDDGNTVGGDDCGARCSACREHCSISLCGDAATDGRITVRDALKLLRAAVGQDRPCPLDACDVDVDGKLSALDALIVLRAAAGLQDELFCSI